MNFLVFMYFLVEGYNVLVGGYLFFVLFVNYVVYYYRVEGLYFIVLVVMRDGYGNLYVYV